MKKLVLQGTVLIIAHLIAVIWHLIVLSHLHPSLTPGRVALFAALINLFPLTALVLLWKGFERPAGILLAVPFILGLVTGGQSHFLSRTAENVFLIPAGEWSIAYQASATLLAVIQILGLWIAYELLRSKRNARTRTDLRTT